MSEPTDQLEETTAVAGDVPGHDVSQLAREQGALRRVATLVAQGSPPPEVFEAVAAEAAKLLQSDFSLIARYEGDGTLTHLASHPLELLSQLGPRTILDGEDLASVIQRSGQPSTINYDDAPGPVAALARELGVRCAVGAPIQVDDETWGVMAAGWAQPGKGTAEAAERTADFTELVATAIANTESREALARLAKEQAALRRVAMLIARDVQPSEIFAAVSEEVARVFDSAAGVARFERGTAVVFVGVANIDIPIGTRWEFQEGMTSAEVYRTGRPARVEDVDWSSVADPIGATSRRLGTRSTVGSPIVVEGRLWGTVIVSSRDELLPPDTEERLERFTELIATAIANATARQARTQLADEQAALHRLAMLVAEDVPAQDIFDAVCLETSQLLGARAVNLSHYTSDGFNLTMAGTHLPVGTRVPIEPNTVAGAIIRTRAPARVDDWNEQPGRLAELLRGLGVRSSLGVPIFVEGRLWGALAAGTDEDEPLPAGTEARLGRFAELLATAISSAATRTELIESRARIVTAGDEARRRIERDLHDGTQQRLVSLALAARAAAAELPAELRSVQVKFTGIAAGLGQAVEELQELSRGIHPAILSDAGLGPALEALALRSPIPVELEALTRERFPQPVEVAAYFAASESLANAAKHSRATRIDVSLARTAEGLLLSIRDNGIGGAGPDRGSGLVGLRDRVEAIGGTLEVVSKPGDGTSIVATFPIRDQLREHARRNS